MVKINSSLLKYKIKQSELSFKELAEIAEISISTIRNVINERTTPSLFVATQLAIILKFSQEDILNVFFPSINFGNSVSKDDLSVE